MTQQRVPTGPGDAAASVVIRELTPHELHMAAALLSDGMLDNPLHLRVFGAVHERRSRRLSRIMTPLVRYVQSNGVMLGAFVQGDLIGALGMIRPGRCRPGLAARGRFALALLPVASPIILWRLHRWLAGWARHDPEAPHWHIGPLAVRPEHRRRGIGRRLMLECCQRMDALDAIAWLETDLDINADFYRRLGFDLVRKEPILGVPTWFMRRAPHAVIDWI